ncbi:MAG TPA: cation diffusion facilitator family transporter [Paludibacteraceae bacterium]|nr:cation diffusion facilitator family transporter [Paludibacteraceae bacterium]HQF11758.1 cation diffusion facilitator family transporter [Paludibacteraceae bacterium]
MKNEDRTSQAMHATWMGFWVNFTLTVFKLLAGFLGKSTAMIADGVHSLSDFITDLIVIIFVRIAGKEKDQDHEYGHGKFETFATFLVSLALAAVGVYIFINGLNKVIQVTQGEIIEPPTIIALIAALVSIIVKEGLYRYTARIGKKINNQAIVANAWHHRSDALSSIGTGLGIAGAIFFGEQARILDPIAGIIVSFFIIGVALKILLPSVNELLERSLPEETKKEIFEIIESNPEILSYHNLKTRKVGNTFAIDIHIKLDKTTTFLRSHDIATEIENKLRNRFGKQTIINIHTEPFNEEKDQKIR